ncbi:hypothetical protein EBBID32_6120 [Sphingobium indicum BiD32]|uniref:Uncharacterized protein n=1 Tax=Sphingobium indicum BiD32 TaxID=1301087 RepID=N1MHN1_9SPHN|nr:hypothetical protein EBBID32_6120 [Sphingobium indicum BiD32]
MALVCADENGSVEHGRLLKMTGLLASRSGADALIVFRHK